MTIPHPVNVFAELGPEFGDPVTPAQFPAHILRFRNDRAAAEIGLDSLDEDQWMAHFGRFQPLDGSLQQPLALRYHGHQFRAYNPQLGDGRGFLFAQLIDNQGRLMDLGTKGSGQTPWSRRGDGRLTLKGGVREILAAEMLEALGVTTSRALSLIETGEALVRYDEPSPTRSAVLVRLSHSHIRYGSFQRLAVLGLEADMERLGQYVLRHIARLDPGPDPWATLMNYAVQGAARLVAQWHVAGFVHGVLNTDNSNISGESFDYGPWRFLPRWDADFTAAYFDESGLYAFGRQAEALQWNLIELARALRLVAEADSLIPALERMPDYLKQAVRQQVLWRLGLERSDASREAQLVQQLEAALQASNWQPDAVWFAFRGGRLPANMPAEFAEFAATLAQFRPHPDALTHPYWQRSAPVTMLIDEVEALWDPIASNDDWSAFRSKLADISQLRAAHQSTDHHNITQPELPNRPNT